MPDYKSTLVGHLKGGDYKTAIEHHVSNTHKALYDIKKQHQIAHAEMVAELKDDLKKQPKDLDEANDMLKKGILDPERPLYSYVPGKKNVDAVTSATEAYFASRGLLYTYRGGRRVDAAHLHIKEWIDAIRSRTQPSCNIDQGFEEGITAQMALIAYRENRTVFWDKENQKIV